MPDTTLTGPPRRTPISLATTTGWWVATLVTLVIVDDLTFGPVFWLISRIGSPLAGFLVALVIYVPAQIALVRAATSGQPGRLAAGMLRRLDLDRRSKNIAAREQTLHERVTGAVTAVLLSLGIGGVIPPMVLWRAGFSTRFVRNLSVVTALVYGIEFGLLHGLAPGLI